MFKHTLARLSALAALGFVQACSTVGPDFAKPAAADAQAQTYVMNGDQKLAAGLQLSPGVDMPAQWWKVFGSSNLDALVEEALSRNYTLAAADAALARAQAEASAARGGQAPQVDLSGSAQRERINTSTFGISGFPSPTINLYSLGSQASFDLDPFGGKRRASESADARAQAQAWRTDAAYLTLTGAVVLRAIDIASLRAQIEAANEIVADDQRTLDMIRRAIEAGGAPRSSEVAASAQLGEDQAKLPPLQLELAQARHALSLLMGRAPGTWNAPEFELNAITAPQSIPVSLPSELVRKRPDILAAEADLHAATADIGVATAALYPRLTLNAAFSLATLQPENLFNLDSSGWSVGPSLTAPLLHGGSLRAQKRGAEAARDEAMARYQHTVLTAFVQVSDLLQAVTQDQALIDAQARAADAAVENARLARLSYENGAGSLLSVIDAQRQAQRARLGAIEASAQLRRDVAALYIATAADWRAKPQN